MALITGLNFLEHFKILVFFKLKFFSCFIFREEKKKKQKQDGCDAEEKSDVTSTGGAAADQGSKGGGGGKGDGSSSQQPLKRGQKVRNTVSLSLLWSKM